MNDKFEGIFSTAAAVLVLFVAMLDPKISVVLAVIALAGMSLYFFLRKK